MLAPYDRTVWPTGQNRPLTRPRDPDRYAASDDVSEERTAVVSLNDLRAKRIELKDRHLLVRVRGAQLGRVTVPFRFDHDREMYSALAQRSVGESQARCKEMPYTDRGSLLIQRSAYAACRISRRSAQPPIPILSS